MKNKLLSCAGGLALVALLGSYAAPAIAQAVRAALVSNVDDPGRVPYQYDLGMYNGTNGPIVCSVCSRDAPPVPAGKRLVITHVSGLFIANRVPGTPFILSLGAGYFNFAAGPPNFLFSPTSQGTDRFGSDWLVFDQPVRAFYDAGSAPRVSLTTTDLTTFQGQFNLSGYMLDCTTGPCTAMVTGGPF